MLAKYGFRIEVAANGIEAVEAVKSRPFDLVLMDVRMPEMDGIEATRRIRELDVRQPRIAAMTADVIQETMDLCFEAGMDDFLTKPVRVQEVLDVIGVAVSGVDRSEEQPEASSGLSVSSMGGLAELLEVDDMELVELLIDTYLTDLAEGVQAIAEGADRKDASAVREAAHKLKSSSRLMAAPALGDMAEKLEAEARTERLPDVATFERFVEEGGRVASALRGLLSHAAAR